MNGRTTRPTVNFDSIFLGEDHPRPADSGPCIGGRYRLDRRLAEGGFGEVWRGFDLIVERAVAVKVPKRNRIGSAEEAEGFLTEARKAASLDHPGIVPVYDVALDGGAYFIVSKLVEGTDLERRLRSGPVSVREAVVIVAQVARHLHFAHRKGLVHRDIKPANLLVDERGAVFVTDFGIAVTADAARSSGADGMGTLAYMGPERLSGGGTQVDARTDIYSLGVVLYRLVAGRLPFEVEAPSDLIDGIINRQPSPPRALNDGVPGSVERVCLKCLEKNPANRYPTAEAVANDLENWLHRTPFWVRTAKLVLWFGGCGVVALALALLFDLSGGATGRKEDGGASESPAKVPDKPPEIREVRRFDGHTGPILAVAYSLDGRRALSGGADAIRVWEVATGKQLDPVAEADRAAGFRSVAFSPDGKHVLAYGWAVPRKDNFTPPSDPGGVRLWDTEAKRLVRRRTGASLDNVSLSFTPDGKQFVWGREESAVPLPGRKPDIENAEQEAKFYRLGVWDVSTWKEPDAGDFAAVRGTPGGARTVAFTPDGRTVLLAGDFVNNDNAVRLFDTATGKIRTRFQGHTNTVRVLACRPDGRGFLSGGDDKIVRVWDTATGQGTAALEGHTDGITALAVSPSGRRALSAAADRTVRLWNLETKEQICSFTGHKEKVLSLAFSPDQRSALAGDEGGALRLLELPADGTAGPGTRADRKDEEPGGGRAEASGENTIRLVRRFEGHAGAIHGVAFWPNGELALSGGGDAVRLWDVRSGNQLQLVNSRCQAVAFSPDGKRVLTYSRKEPGPANPGPLADRGGFRLLRVEEGKLISEWGRSDLDPVCLAASPSHGMFLTTEQQVYEPKGQPRRVIHHILLYDANTGKMVRTPRGNFGDSFAAAEGDRGVRAAAFSPNGGVVLLGGGFGRADFSVRQFDLASDKPPATVPRFEGHTDLVLALAFLPGGRHFLSAGEDRTIRLWNLAPAEQLKCFTGHTGAVTGLAVSPSGRRVLSVASDGSVFLWNIETGNKLGRFVVPKGGIRSVAYSPDGKYGLAGDDAGGLSLLSLPPEPPASSKPE